MTEQGNDVFLDRIGVKTVSDIQTMLKNIGTENLLPGVFVELIKKTQLQIYLEYWDGLQSLIH